MCRFVQPCTTTFATAVANAGNAAALVQFLLILFDSAKCVCG